MYGEENPICTYTSRLISMQKDFLGKVFNM